MDKFWFGALAAFTTLMLIATVIIYPHRALLERPNPQILKETIVIKADSFPPVAGDFHPAQPRPLLEGCTAQTSFSVDFYPLLPRGLNVNRASETLLTLLNGVGPVRAARIVDERNCNGIFLSLDDFFRRTAVSREKVHVCEGWLNARD